MKTDRSSELRARALEVIPGGVNSPVRAFAAVGGDPIFLARGKGSHVWDADDNEYIDFLSSWGPLILGHAPDRVLAVLTETAALSTSFGASTEREVEFAELLTSLIPSLEKVRLVNRGTEATMSAIRLARGSTGRSKLVKMDGGYHGHADGLLVRAGSGAETFGAPGRARRGRANYEAEAERRRAGHLPRRHPDGGARRRRGAATCCERDDARG